eukprot:ctg_2394.g356
MPASAGGSGRHGTAHAHGRPPPSSATVSGGRQRDDRHEDTWLSLSPLLGGNSGGDAGQVSRASVGRERRARSPLHGSASWADGTAGRLHSGAQAAGERSRAAVPEVMWMSGDVADPFAGLDWPAGVAPTREADAGGLATVEPSAMTRSRSGTAMAPLEPIQERKRRRERERRESMRSKYDVLAQLLQEGRRNLMLLEARRQGGGGGGGRPTSADPINAPISADGDAGRSETGAPLPTEVSIPTDKDALLSECVDQLRAFNRVVRSMREEFEKTHAQMDEMRLEKLDLRHDKHFLRDEVVRLRDEVRRLRESAAQLFQASRKGDMVPDVTLEAALRSRLLDITDDVLADAPGDVVYAAPGPTSAAATTAGA